MKSNMNNSEEKSTMAGINWYPGHMAKAKRTLEENLKLVNIVIELCDARLPFSSRNPEIDRILGNKPRVLVFNKADLADPKMNAYWEKYYADKGYRVLFTDAKSGDGVKKVINGIYEAMAEKIQNAKERGRRTPTIYAMIVGIPNVGKSSFINRVAGKAVAETGDKPGVTRAKQWLNMSDDIYLLDTPGMLWPRIENQIAAHKLAASGAVKDDVVDTGELAAYLLTTIEEHYPEAINERFGIKTQDIDTEGDELDYITTSIIGSSKLVRGLKILEECGRKRGCLIKGGEIDYQRAAAIVLDEFRAGKFGKITLDFPDCIEEDAKIREINKENDKAREERRIERKKNYKRRNNR